MKNWSWWTFWPSSSMKFLRWREVHCLAAPRYSAIWLVERYACRVIPRRGWFRDRLADMVMIFFGRPSSIFLKFAGSFSQPVFFTSRIRSGGTIDRWNGACDRQGKLESCPEGRAWKVGFSKISWKIEAGACVGHQIQWNFFVGANFIALRCRTVQLYDS